ncbi:MAG: TRAP transporter substrate-binding protein DctP [Alphaproteobacteria bacterium]
MKSKKQILAVAGAAAIVASLGAAPALSAEVTLRGASCFPIGSPTGKPFEQYVKEVNKAGKGVVQIKMIGGAPAIGSPFTMVKKMAKGVHDVVGCTEGYFGNVLFEVAALRFSEYTYAELRKNGGLDYLQKRLATKNIHYIARYHSFGPFYLFLSKKAKISKPDLKGLHIRVSPIYVAFFTSLGATVQRSNYPQVYTYMENGTVQGFGWPALGWNPSWAKVTKYRVEPGFYDASLHALINLKKWKSLTAAQQDVLTQVGLRRERASETSAPAFRALLAKQKAKTAKQGLSAITFTGADRAKWLSAAREAGWAQVLKRSPKHGAKLKKLFTRN